MKVVLKIAYEGDGFLGFQRQAKGLTVQGCLEEALTQVLREPIGLQGAGRTDVGVHATGQVVSFAVEKPVSITRLCHSVNAVLRAPVRVLEGAVLPSDDTFHARFSAVSRTYSYFLLDGCSPSEEIFWQSRAWCLPRVLDLEQTRQAAALFLGEQDFSTFSYRAQDKHTCVRKVLEFAVQGEPAPSFLAPTAGPRLIRLTITADGFLRRMVRLIAATVAEVGMGMRSLERTAELLQACDPKRAPHPAPSEGLYLERIGYRYDPFVELRGTEHHAVAKLNMRHRFRNL